MTIDRSQTELGYGYLLQVLWRRRLWLLGVLFSAVAAAYAITQYQKPTYRSSMQLLIESNYQGKETEATNQPNQPFADSNVQIDYATQLNLMRSSFLLKLVVDRLGAEYPDVTIEHLKKNLVLTKIMEENVETKIIEAVYTSDDPVKTQRVLQTVQDVYQDYNLEQQKLRLSRGLAFINEQLPQEQQKANAAQLALEQFRQQQKTVDPEQQAATIAESLNAIQQERIANRAELQEAQATYKATQQRLALSTPQSMTAARLSQSPRYQALLDEIQQTDLALAQQRLRYTDTAPPIVRLQEQRQQQQNLLEAEMKQIMGAEAQLEQDDRATNQGMTGQMTQQATNQNQSQPNQGGDQGTSNQVANGTANAAPDRQLNGELDLSLANQLVQTQITYSALAAREQSLAQAEQSLRQALEKLPGVLAQYNRLQPDVQITQETVQKLLAAQQDLGLQIARGGFAWQVVEEPQLGSFMGPNRNQNLILGAIVGLLLGCGTAFVRNAMDDSIQSPDELKQQAALPLLGMVPEMPQSGLSLPFRQSDALMPSTLRVINWGPFREAVDLIYKNIQLVSSSTSLKSIVITSTLAGEGKSTLALGLAISAARLHQRVLLIDADLRRPSLHKQLDLYNGEGLTTLLTNESRSSQSVIQKSSLYSDLSILTSGPTPIDPAKLLSSRRMKDLMTEFERKYDLVILDASPALGIVDAVLAASCCDGLVMVERIGQVTRTELNQITSTLNQFNAIGIIANGAAMNTSNHQYLSYRSNV